MVLIGVPSFVTLSEETGFQDGMTTLTSSFVRCCASQETCNLTVFRVYRKAAMRMLAMSFL